MGDVIDHNQRKILKLEKDLSLVEFYIYSPSPNDFALINRDKFYPIVVKEIEEYFLKNGIDARWLGPVDGGGGGFETLLEIIKKIWENKDIIEFLLSLIGFFKNRVIGFASKKVSDNKISLDIGLSVSSDENIDGIPDEISNSFLTLKLKNLLLISNDLAEFISAKHGFLSINTNFEATVRSQDFIISFSLIKEQMKDINVARYLKIIENAKIRFGKVIRYSVTNLWLIKREEGEISFTGRSSSSHKFKNYYFIFSSRLLKDLIRDTKDSIFSQTS